MMKLLRLSSHHVGPFLPGEEITFQPDVTVLTGQNDAGKTALLKLVARITTRYLGYFLSEDDVSLAHKMPPTEPWRSDKRIRAQAVFLADTSQGGGPIIVDYTFPREVESISFSGRFQVNKGGHDAAGSADLLVGWPRAVMIPAAGTDDIRASIPLESMTDAEKALMFIAFEKHIHAGEFVRLPRIERRGAIEEAEERLNRRLVQFLPASLGYRFVLEPPSEAEPSIELGLLDSHGGYSSLGQRGSGVRKLVNLLGRLAIENIGSESAILLMDEPENSLHADAQHALRFALEQLGSLPSLQVIYATHSPAMINPTRPECLRILRRVRVDQQARTRFVRSGDKDKFATVRTSLGISPADSLLYSPLTIFVEGSTEVLCIPLLIRRLAEAQTPGFEGAFALLSNCLFVSVGGDHFGHQCTLAKGYGIIPLVYADGDVAKKVRSQLARDHGDVAVIASHDDSLEVEDLVPRDVYFAALAKFLENEDATVNEAAFISWEASAKLPPKMMFSKKVGRWVEDTFDPNFSGKPEILQMACANVPVEQIRVESLERLVKAVRKGIEKSMTPFFEAKSTR